MFVWETIDSFGSLRERDRFVIWMQGQVASGLAEAIETPSSFDSGERWFRHVATGSLWRLTPEENPHGPGFWAADA
jgi:hypothetical protein